MFTVTMAYAVVKDFKDKCKGEYAAKSLSLPPSLPPCSGSTVAFIAP
jgi:hypothetical protein